VKIVRRHLLMRALGKHVNYLDACNYSRCVQGEGGLFERLNFGKTGAIALSFKLFATWADTRALCTLMIRMHLMADGYGGWLRSHMVMNRHR